MRGTAPVATYRLQFSAEFGFVRARDLVPYLDRLGVGALYASPLFAARRGSPHGYDVTDPTRLNPELGARRDFAGLSRALRRHDMGLLLDIVPNHMAASPQSDWWSDLLAGGRSSRRARYFDVDWDADPDGKVVLPILGGPYGTVLRAGELVAGVDEGGPHVRYYETRLPLAEGTYEGVPADADALHRLLEAQPYRLVHWRAAGEQLNYRRFFDITDLVGVRIEDEAVFDSVHALAFRLLRDDRLTGLRVDHVDGLRDPRGYLERLRDRAGERSYLVVEKIVTGDEAVPDEWPVDGTTGYDFLNFVNAVLVDEAGVERLAASQARFTGVAGPLADVTYERKKQALRDLFPGETRSLAGDLAKLARRDRDAVDLPRRALTEALVEVAATFPVYRTYVGPDGIVSPTDRGLIERAIEEARRRGPTIPDAAFDFFRRVLLMEAQPRDEALRFVARWQQLTGPATAKGLEDTALYAYHTLLSLNDVGADPEGAAFGIAAFHERMRRRARRSPHTMNATSTHDTKRSEDVRARIDVLSEMPDAWASAVRRWRRMTADAKPRVGAAVVPSAMEESLLYQTLAGAWPLDDGELPQFRERLKAYVVKAAREAKTTTSWLQQDEEYEGALEAFVDALLAAPGSSFVDDFLRLQPRIAYHGMLNALSMTVLKIAAPGVPDIYQGTELWDLSLVDPDNRRPVDFAHRAGLLAGIARRSRRRSALLREMLAEWRDGRVKLYVTWRALTARREQPALFLDGAYESLAATGERAEHVVPFARHLDGRWAVVIVPRLTVGLTRPERPPIGRRVWRDTAVRLPAASPRAWSDAFTGRVIEAPDGVLPLRATLAEFPVALLLGEA